MRSYNEEDLSCVYDDVKWNLEQELDKEFSNEEFIKLLKNIGCPYYSNIAALFNKFKFLTISSNGHCKINKIPDLKEFINMINLARKKKTEQRNKVNLTKIDEEYCIKYLKDRGYRVLKPKTVEYEEC